MQLLEFKSLFTPTSVDEITSWSVEDGFELMRRALSLNLWRGVRNVIIFDPAGGDVEEGFDLIEGVLYATVDKLNCCL